MGGRSGGTGARLGGVTRNGINVRKVERAVQKEG